MQHLLVTLIFAVCLILVLRRIVRIVKNARGGASHCDTCTEHSCPLREAAKRGDKRVACPDKKSRS